MARKSVKTTKKARTSPAKSVAKKTAKKAAKKAGRPGRRGPRKKLAASDEPDPLVVAKQAIAGLKAELDRLDPEGTNKVIVDMKMKAEALDRVLTCQVGLTQPLAG